jgi:hypothetical protein
VTGAGLGLDSESFGSLTELGMWIHREGIVSDELYLLPEYRGHLMSV